MCRRSKSPFAILVHSLPLVIEVKRKASCFAFGFDQFLFVCNDEGKSRYALDAFVCTADDKVDSPFSDRDIHTTEKQQDKANTQLNDLYINSVLERNALFQIVGSDSKENNLLDDEVSSDTTPATDFVLVGYLCSRQVPQVSSTPQEPRPNLWQR